MKKSILCFGGPVLDSYRLVEDGVMEKYGVTKGHMALYDDLTPPEHIKQMYKELKFTEFEMGGSAINTVKAYALLGGSVGLVCSYGDDDRKDIIESEAKRLGIKVFPYIYENSPTSYLMILVTPDAQRTVLGSFYPSFQLDGARVDFSCINDYDYSFLESYSFTDDPKYDAIFRTLEQVEKYNKKFIFALSNPFCLFKFKDEMYRFMNHENCKVVIGNAQEFLGLYDKFDNLKDLMNHLLEYNRQHNKWEILVVTDGAAGAWLLHNHEMVFVPAPKVDKVVDTTGAGDYFAAGALIALLNGYSLEVAAHLSNMFAADIISKVGVRLSDEVVQKAKEYLASHK